jgi:triosephosphate isomerase (TIM)
MARKPLIAGNWKMFGRRADIEELAALWGLVKHAAARVDALICPPAPYIGAALAAAAGTGLLLGAQDCCAVGEDSARTGDVNAAMLADVGARYVIVGHSERRAQHGESNALVVRKAEAALAAGLTPIICVGETLAEREADRLAAVVTAQVRESTPHAGDFVIAYEPVWAIGGKTTPTPAEIAEVHGLIRAALAAGASSTRILYGGSVAPKNAAEIFAADGVDGALVGRASLKAADFAAIILAHPAVT